MISDRAFIELEVLLKPFIDAMIHLTYSNAETIEKLGEWGAKYDPTDNDLAVAVQRIAVRHIPAEHKNLAASFTEGVMLGLRRARESERLT